jgi:hypothetical protein
VKSLDFGCLLRIAVASAPLLHPRLGQMKLSASLLTMESERSQSSRWRNILVWLIFHFAASGDALLTRVCQAWNSFSQARGCEACRMSTMSVIPMNCLAKMSYAQIRFAFVNDLLASPRQDASTVL